MNKSILYNRNFVNLGVTCGLLGMLIFLIKSSTLTANDTLSLAITLDLLLTVPLIYFLLIRKSDIPKTTVIPVMLVGLLIGSYFLPKESQTYLNLWKTWVLPFIEISILVFVILKVRQAQKSFNGIKEDSMDFYGALKSACYEIFPKQLALLFATEVAVIYYGFVNWKKRILQPNEFSYHIKSGTPALMGALIFIITIETIALHLLIERWNAIAAWILSGLSIYTTIQILGFGKSLSQRPILLTDKSLILRYGILNEVEIPLADIDNIDLTRKPLNNIQQAIKLSPLGDFESHNVVIRLNKENKSTGLYGKQKKFRVIGLHIDQPVQFKEKIEMAFNNT